MAEEKKKTYYIRAMGKAVEVPKDLYLAYYRMRRQEQGLVEKDEYNGTLHYNDLDTDEILGVESFSSNEDETVEDVAIRHILTQELHQAINSLSDADRELIYALYFEGLSQRELSRRTGIPQKTIDNRKARILRILGKYLKN